MISSEYPALEIPTKTVCYHCGEDCHEGHVVHEDKDFCCDGCKTVFEILNQNNLCTYYNLDNTGKPVGVSMKNNTPDKFAYLDNPDIAQALIKYRDDKQEHTTFYIPHIHCHSCIWLLENLHTIEKGILQSEVNFPKKELRVIFDPTQITLRKVAELSTAIGYEPYISLQDISQQASDSGTQSRAHLYKIGIAGFAFSNIMLLSLPEYFSWGNFYDMPTLRPFFGFFNLLLTLPVFFYSASEFFISAYKSIRFRYLNIDAPIALAIFITFLRSLYEVFTQTGIGYFDSLTGIVFFMLIGRYFQQKTYNTLSFERDYKSYFPVAVLKKQADKELQIPVSRLKVGDKIIIHNNELVPADALLYKGTAHLDYSFVTGEAKTVRKEAGEIVYAGGQHQGSNIELEVMKEVSQSYLTQLWNNSHLKSSAKARQEESNKNNAVFTQTINRYFTGIVLSIAALALLYWLFEQQPARALNAFTAVLIIACPCALLLSASFTAGNLLRLLGKNKFYLKNNTVIEQLSNISSIVFDKTGTITQANAANVAYEGQALTLSQKQQVLSVFAQSNHPLSRKITADLRRQLTYTTTAAAAPQKTIENFVERNGQGIEAQIGGDWVRLGSEKWLLPSNKNNDNISSPTQKNAATYVYVNINGQNIGRFCISHQYRPHLTATVQKLQKKYKTYLLSGDNDAEKAQLSPIFGSDSRLLFNQKPEEKLNFIAALQQNKEQVMMVGDGLNDAGALLQSNVGVVVSDDTNNFSPACDAILDGSQLQNLPNFIRLAKTGRKIIRASFAISLVYNLIGLYFATQGSLQPVIAAILMPLSSISIIVFTFLSSNVAARKLGLS